MNTLKEKLSRFMTGRYGADQLYRFLNGTAFALVLASMAVKSPIFVAAIWTVMGLAIWRSFSRNIARRRKENELFLALTKPIRKKSALSIRRLREFRTHRFRSCPGCKAVIRLPFKKGRRVINCPKCHAEFETRILM